jgi:hypothetical protein
MPVPEQKIPVPLPTTAAENAGDNLPLPTVLLTNKEAADFLRISERSLKHRRDMGMIAFIQEMPNGKVLYDKADLQQHILKNRRNGRS